MVNRAESRAELTLTPPHMGKVDVTLTMSGDQTNASFVAASPAAREALEQALPRLREILADAGITLGQTSVNAESPRNGREQETLEARGETRRGEVPAAAPQWTRRGNGLVDTFA
ncbi:MAG: flagellar hook-length control protein FliK [Rhodocyclaceae bacterium]|nr:flagellar hook-length control protein FliK [Rhodocyclaceae bacterium]